MRNVVGTRCNRAPASAKQKLARVCDACFLNLSFAMTHFPEEWQNAHKALFHPAHHNYISLGTNDMAIAYLLSLNTYTPFKTF